jgi:metal-sulfur cluster biosynthetic enzyme
MSVNVENANPSIFQKLQDRGLTTIDYDNDIDDQMDEREVFDIIRNLQDPEHPLTLEELNVLDIESVRLDNERNECFIEFTPTIPHCSMATLIGLSIQVKLLRSLPSHYKIYVKIKKGTHASEIAINKQLGI